MKVFSLIKTLLSHFVPDSIVFFWVDTHQEEVVIQRKENGNGLEAVAVGGWPNPIRYYNFPIFSVFVTTRFGNLEVRVSKVTYGRLRTGDHVRVEFQRGRWFGKMQGKLIF